MAAPTRGGLPRRDACSTPRRRAVDGPVERGFTMLLVFTEQHKKAMYEASFQVLHPYITRVKQVMFFKDDLVGKFCANLELLIRVEAKKKSERPKGDRGEQWRVGGRVESGTAALEIVG